MQDDSGRFQPRMVRAAGHQSREMAILGGRQPTGTVGFTGLPVGQTGCPQGDPSSFDRGSLSIRDYFLHGQARKLQSELVKEAQRKINRKTAEESNAQRPNILPTVSKIVWKLLEKKPANLFTASGWQIETGWTLLSKIAPWTGETSEEQNWLGLWWGKKKKNRFFFPSQTKCNKISLIGREGKSVQVFFFFPTRFSLPTWRGEQLCGYTWLQTMAQSG